MKPERCPTCRRRIVRNSEQNKRYWALLHVMAEKIRPMGELFSAEVWHVYAKSRWLGCDDVKLPGRNILTIPRSTADLDVAEFGEYMDKVEAWANVQGAWLEDKENAA